MDHPQPSEARFRDTPVGGVPIRNTTTRALIRFLNRRRKGRAPLAIGFVNQNFVVACRALAPLARADPTGILLLNDGVGIALAGKLATGRWFAENLNGTDLVPRLLEELEGDLDIFILGGTPPLVALARQLVDAMPRRRVVGAIDGFSIWRDEAATIAAIKAARPDILFVGFGNPKQELWILKHRRELDVPVIFAVGALFEWMTGMRRRAPLFLRRAGCEWLYRLAIDPRRLFRRYTIDVVHFFYIVWRASHPRPAGAGGRSGFTFATFTFRTWRRRTAKRVPARWLAARGDPRRQAEEGRRLAETPDVSPRSHTAL